MQQRLDVLVLDGTNLVHRCWHAMAASDMRGADGEPIWAVAGLFNYISKLVGRHDPQRLIVAFDVEGGCPSRKVLAPQYKAGRKSPDPTLISQLIAAPELVARAGFSVATVVGWEADDIAATVAAKAVTRGLTCGVVSSDKDLHQTVRESQVVVLKPEGIVVDAEALFKKYGIEAHRWPEYAALLGEASDNLEGVDGIGPKRASALITHFNDVSAAFDDETEAAGVIGGSAAAALAAGRERFIRNRKVGVLRSDLDLGVTGELPRSPGSVLAESGLKVQGERLDRLLTAQR